MLKELQHRIRNSFATIVSLIDLEMDAVEHPTAVQVLADLRSRVMTISDLYRHLEFDETIASLQLDTYLATISAEILDPMRMRRPGVRVETRFDAVEYPTNLSVSIGIIMNEALTNVTKYAFPMGRAGTVRVGLERRPDGILLEVADDGVGRSAPALHGTGMGTQLIGMLSEQIGATLEWDDAVGTTMRLRLPLRG